MRNNNLIKKEVPKCLCLNVSSKWQVFRTVTHAVARNAPALTVLVRWSYDRRGGLRTAAAVAVDVRARRASRAYSAARRARLS